MINRLFHLGGLDDLPPAERVRREHESWLNRAWRDWRCGTASPPWIPLRKVSEGGYSDVTTTGPGREWADEWWESAWERLDAYR